MSNCEIKDGKITAVEWMAVFPALKLAKVGREALQPARLAAAMIWGGLLWGGALALDKIFDTDHTASFLSREGNIAAQLGGGSWNPLVWGGALGRLLLGHPYEFVAAKPVVGSLALLWILLCTLLAGAFVSRLTALRAAGVSDDGWRAGTSFLRLRLVAVLGAPALVLGALGVLYGLLMLAGLACFSIPALAGVGAVLFGLLLPVGAVAVLVAVAWILGSGLMLPAAAVDGHDAFDVPGRAVSYVLSRPWTIGLHAAALSLFALFFIGLAVMFKEFTVNLTAEAVHHGSVGDTFRDAWNGQGEQEFAINVLKVWRDLLQLLVAGYAFSFFFTGLTRIYLLVRESADGVPETDVWMAEGDKQANAPETAA